MLLTGSQTAGHPEYGIAVYTRDSDPRRQRSDR